MGHILSESHPEGQVVAWVGSIMNWDHPESPSALTFFSAVSPLLEVFAMLVAKQPDPTQVRLFSPFPRLCWGKGGGRGPWDPQGDAVEITWFSKYDVEQRRGQEGAFVLLGYFDCLCCNDIGFSHCA